MVEADSLVKRFGEVIAVDNLSFHIEKNEVLGFLGPNGAGKTTTMRMLTGYFTPTSGEVRINGVDMVENPREAKRFIGYLPEHPPLYPDMTVKEYLRFVAELHGVKKIRERLDYVQKVCSLSPVWNRLISQISKGFCQRVGLAKAIVHNPSVIVLDEPTIGLDPEQIIETRNLIKSLGEEHSVILSTHILSEANMTCDRVMIINRGKLVGEGTPERLSEELQSKRNIALIVGREIDKSLFSGIPVEIQKQEKLDDRFRLELSFPAEDDLCPELARRITEAGISLYQMQEKKPTLEEIFLSLVKEVL